MCIGMVHSIGVKIFSGIVPTTITTPTLLPTSKGEPSQPDILNI